LSTNRQPLLREDRGGEAGVTRAAKVPPTQTLLVLVLVLLLPLLQLPPLKLPPPRPTLRLRCSEPAILARASLSHP